MRREDDARPAAVVRKRPPPSPPPKSDKAAYEWPTPRAEWRLVPNDEADVSLLPGEGVVSASIAELPRKGRGVLFNAIHRDPNAQRASKNIMEAIVGVRRMRKAIEERGLPSDLRFCLFTERAPYEFYTSKQCRSEVWPACGTFAQQIKLFDEVRFYDDYPRPPIVERRERFQTWPDLWLMRIMATLNSPFAQTLVVDSALKELKRRHGKAVQA